VPGTRALQYKDAQGTWVDALVFPAGYNYFRVDVPPGKDGQLWRFYKCYKACLLSTVPPYLARRGAEVLLPIEVVEADQPVAP
jgi:hypothetical protein